MWHLTDHAIPPGGTVHVTRLAGREVTTNFPLAPANPAAETRVVPAPDLSPATGTPVEAQLGGRRHVITEARDASGARCFRVDHGLVLRLGASSAETWASTPEACADVPEALLGAGLLLLAAGSGCFAVHAAAIADDRGVVLLAGPSGQGKSSLARPAARAFPGRFGAVARCADDIVLLDAEGRFLGPVPQLKLDAMLLPDPANPRIRRVVWPEFDDTLAGPELRPLPPATVRLRLIRDSVAARLFDAPMLAAHLAFVTRLSAATPGFALARPRVDPALVGMANRQAIDLLLA
jgi:hypothetical protein